MTKEEKMNPIQELYLKYAELHEKFAELWMDETLFHWDWWGGAILSIGAWTFWVFYRKKESTHRLLYAGVTVMLISLCLDYIGSSLGLWHYSGKLTPSFPAWLPFNFCMLPVTIMFLIQTKPHITAWKKGLLFGALTSFVGEPIFSYFGYYVPIHWEYICSFPIYSLIYLFADWLAKREAFSDSCCQ